MTYRCAIKGWHETVADIHAWQVTRQGTQVQTKRRRSTGQAIHGDVITKVGACWQETTQSMKLMQKTLWAPFTAVSFLQCQGLYFFVLENGRIIDKLTPQSTKEAYSRLKALVQRYNKVNIWLAWSAHSLWYSFPLLKIMESISFTYTLAATTSHHANSC